MPRRGRKRRLGVEDEYWHLILTGVGTIEACRMVGIGRKTGYRWRAERGGLPPLRRVERERSDRYLSLLERQRIATLRRQRLLIREIARQLGRSPSTISRELRRNSASHDVGGYDGDLAHSRARERLERPRAAGSRRSRGCGRPFRHDWSSSGARSRSRRGCALRIRIGRGGTCVTRPSTRRSTTAGMAA